jgi:glycosyltransferase involved in cell wall biosynthesis
LKSDDSTTLSIVTVTKNDLDGLRKTGESVMGQDMDVEWIVVDADSGPLTCEYLNLIHKKGAQKVVWISENDRGLYDGMNKGLKMSNGHLVLFLNSGDTLATSQVARTLVEHQKRFQWRWATAVALRVNADGNPSSLWAYVTPTLAGLAFGVNTFCHQATFYTRKFIDEVGLFDIELMSADHDLNLRAFKRNKPCFIPLITTYFLNGGWSSKWKLGNSFMELSKIRRKNDLLIGNSILLDAALAWCAVLLIKTSGFIWRMLSYVNERSNFQKGNTLSIEKSSPF